MAITTRESDKFMLRLPDGMREAIRLAAEENNRSMNAEIVARLTESLHPKQEMASFQVTLEPEEKSPLESNLRALEASLREQKRHLEALIASMPKR